MVAPRMVDAVVVDTGPNGVAFVRALADFNATCEPCKKTLEGLLGQAPLTPREKAHGYRLVRVVRVAAKGKTPERLVASCATCGAKLMSLEHGSVTRALWDAVPAPGAVK